MSKSEIWKKREEESEGGARTEVLMQDFWGGDPGGNQFCWSKWREENNTSECR